MKSLLESILNHSFEFNALSYEIYENGSCIQKCYCNTRIIAEYSIFGEMMFCIQNNTTYIDDNFSFNTESDDLLEDRVQYGRLKPIDDYIGVSSTPIVCNLFPQNGILRLATPNPLRIVEFAGKYNVDGETDVINSETLYQNALKIIQENNNASNGDEVWNIAHALQLLIEANKMEQAITELKIKIIKEMASCNYKIGNLSYAYSCAFIAKEKLDEYIKSCHCDSIDEELTRILLGENDCNEIIETIQKNRKGNTRLLQNHVLKTLCTDNIRRLYPPKDECSFTRDELYHLVHALEQTKKVIASQAFNQGEYHIAEQVESIFNMYKYPLYYIWQKYYFGNDDEVWVYGESIIPYQFFIS